MYIEITGHEGNTWLVEIELTLEQHAALTERIKAITKHDVHISDRIKGTIKGA
jgi:hypothetical protein